MIPIQFVLFQLADFAIIKMNWKKDELKNPTLIRSKTCKKKCDMYMYNTKWCAHHPLWLWEAAAKKYAKYYWFWSQTFFSTFRLRVFAVYWFDCDSFLALFFSSMPPPFWHTYIHIQMPFLFVLQRVCAAALAKW